MKPILLFLFIFFIFAQAQAQDTRVTVDLPEGYAVQLSQEALQAFQSVQKPIESKLGITLLMPVKIALCRNHDEMEKTVGVALPHWTFGVAVPSRYILAVNVQKVAPPENSLAPVIRHETVHLYLGNWERYSGQSLPLWLNEGLSEWFSGAMHFTYREELLDTVVFDRVIPFASLETNFPKNAERAQQAYLQSLSMVQYLAQQYGEGVFKDIFDQYKRTESFNQALEASVSKNLEELQEDWRKFITPSPLFFWMWRFRYLFSIFTIAGILVLIAFYRQYRRKKALIHVWREQEQREQEIRILQRAWQADWPRILPKLSDEDLAALSNDNPQAPHSHAEMQHPDSDPNVEEKQFPSNPS